ncbi:MAG: MaoC family dehydratase N-terminal domain-containing protein [Betaproteobacteria bacterium]|nr:MaoC family dehydratase N-terminal domain-containing protein [Betaproteobacteria bacterium]MBI3054305.1 MaoC family dehydratase N-terminal domain-containing protein [Betaproteobacteria bacterium]
MPIDYEKLINWKIPEVGQQFTRRDTMLYALGVGLGADPCDASELKFVYEQNLQALPTMAIILGYPGPWHAHPDTGITRSHVVHGEQSFVIHRPLPVEGEIAGLTKVTGVVDKGKDKGALVMTECTVRDKAGGNTLCTLTSTSFCRADGGFGGPAGPAKTPHPIPATPPDAVCDLPTLPQAALIYRLSGDYNPLHAEPAAAQKAGYPRPILHGRCTFSVAGHAILKTCCGYDPARFRSMAGRFSSPVYPGETIRTEIWRNGSIVSFRSMVPARGVTVLNNGRAEVV